MPTSDKIDVNQYGSYIKIISGSNSKIDGELIAIDSHKIIVLTADSNKCSTVFISDVKKFQLKYAKPKHYGHTIPVFLLSTISHGLGSIITFPVNLIVIVSVTAAGNRAFVYSDKRMTFSLLNMFARFPQGIPPGVDLVNIK